MPFLNFIKLVVKNIKINNFFNESFLYFYIVIKDKNTITLVRFFV